MVIGIIICFIDSLLKQNCYKFVAFFKPITLCVQRFFSLYEIEGRLPHGLYTQANLPSWCCRHKNVITSLSYRRFYMARRWNDQHITRWFCSATFLTYTANVVCDFVTVKDWCFFYVWKSFSDLLKMLDRFILHFVIIAVIIQCEHFPQANNTFFIKYLSNNLVNRDDWAISVQ